MPNRVAKFCEDQNAEKAPGLVEVSFNRVVVDL